MHRRNFIKSMAATGATAAIGRRAYAVAKGKPIVQLNPLDYTIQSISPPTR